MLLSIATVWLNDVAVSWGRSGMRRVVIESVEEVAYAGWPSRNRSPPKTSRSTSRRVDGRKLIRPTFTFQPRSLDEPGFTVTAEMAELRTDLDADTLTVVFQDAESESGRLSGQDAVF